MCASDTPPLGARASLCTPTSLPFLCQVYFYRNGKVIHQLSGIRGEVLPCFSVGEGAVIEANFGGKDYAQGMPNGFQGIIKSMSLL